MTKTYIRLKTGHTVICCIVTGCAFLCSPWLGCLAIACRIPFYGQSVFLQTISLALGVLGLISIGGIGILLSVIAVSAIIVLPYCAESLDWKRLIA